MLETNYKAQFVFGTSSKLIIPLIVGIIIRQLESLKRYSIAPCDEVPDTSRHGVQHGMTACDEGSVISDSHICIAISRG